MRRFRWRTDDRVGIRSSRTSPGGEPPHAHGTGRRRRKNLLSSEGLSGNEGSTGLGGGVDPSSDSAFDASARGISGARIGAAGEGVGEAAASAMEAYMLRHVDPRVDSLGEVHQAPILPIQLIASNS